MQGLTILLDPSADDLGSDFTALGETVAVEPKGTVNGAAVVHLKGRFSDGRTVAVIMTLKNFQGAAAAIHGRYGDTTGPAIGKVDPHDKTADVYFLNKDEVT